jgi:hypothetical protein
MVARSGDGWVLAPALALLMEQLDDYDPGRSRASDGSIGDPSHQARPSDHNPRRGADGTWYVTAVDVTSAPWLDQWVQDVLTRDGRVKYLIRRGRYWQRIRWSPTDPVQQWVPYSGPNRHDHHVHISLQLGAVNDRHRWAMPGQTAPIQEDISIVDAATRTYLDQRFAEIQRDFADVVAKIRATGGRLADVQREVSDDETDLTAAIGGAQAAILAEVRPAPSSVWYAQQVGRAEIYEVTSGRARHVTREEWAARGLHADLIIRLDPADADHAALLGQLGIAPVAS